MDIIAQMLWMQKQGRQMTVRAGVIMCEIPLEMREIEQTGTMKNSKLASENSDIPITHTHTHTHTNYC